MFDASSYHFTWFAVPVLAIGFADWLLGVATLRHERGSAASATFGLATVGLGVWLIGLGAAYSTDDKAVALAWGKFSLLGTVFVPACALFGCASVSVQLRAVRALTIIGFAFSFVLAAIVLRTDWLIADVHRYYWGYYPIYGWVGPILVAYYVLYMGASGYVYRVAYSTTSSRNQRQRLKYLLVGLLIANPAMVDFLPTFHIAIYPAGYAFISVFVALAGYAIWRYRLVDITPALAARQIIDTMAEGLVVVDRDGIVHVANDAAAAIWGRGKSLIGSNCGELDARWDEDAIVRLLDPDREHQLEVTYTASDGSSRAVILSSSKLEDHLGEWVGTVYIIYDITERWRTEERFRSLVQNASDLITVIDPDTTIRYQSPAIRQVLGYDAEATLGLKLVDAVHPDDAAKFVASLGDLMTKPAGTITGDGRARDSLGVWRHLEFTGSDQRNNPAIGGLVLNVRDVSERKQLEEQLRDQALHDPLTKLANRTKFADRLEHALRRRSRSNGHVAVLFMDLDNFKGVNDSLGHSIGDLLLAQVANRVSKCLRPGDLAARLGGDEFALLLEDLGRAEEATGVAGRVFDALQEPFDVAGTAIVVRASVGIATTAGESESTAEALLRDADIAMYVAKSQGKGCYSVYDPAMQASMVERLELVGDLPRALERGEFVLHYQPMFRLRSNGLAGVEALLRWQHPKRGLVPPQEFITLAEESGAILAIGGWVLTHACRQAFEWQQAYPSVTGWTMSVNVSARQLQQASFVDEVAQALAASGLEPSRLMLEITESVMMVDVSLMLRRLRELKALGIRLAIDDFGTGYSSLSYLRQFPFDLLKIDKSFIDDLGTVVSPKELTKAIIELGKTLDLELVAEGIERGEQLTKLQSMNCELGQGFLFARPLDREGIEELLQSLQTEAEAEAA